MSQIALENTDKAPVLLIMDEAMGDAYMKLSEKNKGEVFRLYSPY